MLFDTVIIGLAALWFITQPISEGFIEVMDFFYIYLI
ncbi:hypothetical protein ABMA09_18310 [Erwinia rhapontici]